jgi:hypothetical protein
VSQQQKQQSSDPLYNRGGLNISKLVVHASKSCTTHDWDTFNSASVKEIRDTEPSEMDTDRESPDGLQST